MCDENEITECDLTAELALVLAERYPGCVMCEGNGIALTFENGKGFKIEIKAV